MLFCGPVANHCGLKLSHYSEKSLEIKEETKTQRRRMSLCLFESFDCLSMLECTGFRGRNLPAWRSKTSLPLSQSSLSLCLSLCPSACYACFLCSCVLQQRWNSMDVISIALLETTATLQNGFRWLGEGIKSWMDSKTKKDFQFETGNPVPCLSHWDLFHWI